MNASKIRSAESNAAALHRQLQAVLAKIPYATGAARTQLTARATRLRAARNVAISR